MCTFTVWSRRGEGDWEGLEWNYQPFLTNILTYSEQIVKLLLKDWKSMNGNELTTLTMSVQLQKAILNIKTLEQIFDLKYTHQKLTCTE